MNNVKKVKVIQYTGTIESYNELIINLKLDRQYCQVLFMTDKYQSTNLFTGIISIRCFANCNCKLAGIILKPGDFYNIDLDDEKEFLRNKSESLTDTLGQNVLIQHKNEKIDKCPCLKTCCDKPKIQSDQDSSECLNCQKYCLCNS